jgi:Mor family transcriptional regulator
VALEHFEQVLAPTKLTKLINSFDLSNNLVYKTIVRRKKKEKKNERKEEEEERKIEKKKKKKKKIRLRKYLNGTPEYFAKKNLHFSGLNSS